MPTFRADINGRPVTIDAADEAEAAIKFDQAAKAAPAGPEKVIQALPGLLGSINAGVRGAADAITGGYADELAAYLSDKTGIGDQGGGYEGNVAAQRAIDKYDEREHPTARMTGQVAGGVAAAIAAPELLARSASVSGVVPRVIASAAEGGLQGAIYGTGSAEGDPMDRLAAVPNGAATGALFGAGGAAVGEAASNVAGRVARYIGFDPGSPPPPPGREFNIPLTRGQETGDIAQQTFEQDAITGGRGPQAQQVLNRFRDRQQAAVANAGEQVTQQLAGAPVATRNVQELGENTLQAARNASQQARTGVDQAYQAARDAGTNVRVEAVMLAPQHIRQSLQDSRIIIADDQLTRYANRALGELDRFGQLEGTLADQTTTRLLPEDARITGVSLNNIEQMRKNLNADYNNATAPEDKRAMRAILRGFDGWLDEAADRGLLEGSQEGLQLFKDARSARRNYGRLYEGSVSQRDDDAGRLIEKMINKDMGANEVVNAIVGASKAGEKGVSTRMVRRLQRVLGSDSPEFGQVRQMAWERTLQGAGGSPNTPAGPQAVATAIERMLEGQGSSFANALYTPEQRALMRRYANVLKMTVPDTNATNPPRSGSAVSRAMDASMRVGTALSAALLGHQAGGMTGAVVGGTAGIAAQSGRDFWNAARARAATRGAPPPVQGVPVLGPSFNPVRPGATRGGASSEIDEGASSPLYLHVRPRNR